MITRTVNQQTYQYGYDSENRMTSVSGAAQAQFTYNGDGQRVIATESVTTTVFVGDYFEYNITASEITKYYFAGGVRLAMQRGSGGVKFILGDHLGSTSVTLNADGTLAGEHGYYPWGPIRFTEGSIETEYTFTGQYSYRASFGLMYYRARWYSTELGRFAQPDNIIPDPGNVLDYDRYQYVRSNPSNYTDPSGNKPCEDWNNESNCVSIESGWKAKPQEEPLSWGAAEIYKIFMLMKKTKGWWNANGNFTLAMFVGLWILVEANWGAGHGFPYELAAALIAQAVAQNLFVGGFRNATCQSRVCFNGVFEFMFAQSRMGDSLFKGPNGKPWTEETISKFAGPSSKGLEDPISLMKAAEKYGNAALHPSSLNYDRQNAPASWGNNPEITAALSSSGLREGYLYGPDDAVLFFWGNFLIYTTNQSGRHFSPLMK